MSPRSPHDAAKSLAGMPSASCRLACPAPPEALLVEDLALAQQVIDRPAQPGRQDGQRLALAALLLLPLLPRLGPRAGPQKQARRLGEGPAQLRIADLPPFAVGRELLAPGLVHAAHQP